MGAWAYCNNADCSHEFDKPSFAEILVRKRKCPACGNVNYVSDDLGTALDAAFAEVAELVGAKSKLDGAETHLHDSHSNAAIIDAVLSSMRQQSDILGRASSCNVAAGQEANTAPKFVGTLVCSAAGIAELHLPAGVTLPAGYYTVLLTEGA